MGIDGYTKLFSSIVTSTIWGEDSDTRVVWITMLALSDAEGFVTATVPGLARLAGVSLEACRAALAKFEQPDPDSRSKEHEGRRIRQADGGFELLNLRKYRDLRNEDDRRRQNREAQRRFRDRHRVSRTVSKRNAVSATSAQAEAEAEAEYSDSFALNAQPAPTAKPNSKPVPMSGDWTPSAAQVSALAVKHDCSEDRIRAQVPEFRLYWIEGKGQGKRRNPKGWAASFAKRVDDQAERGFLYAEHRVPRSAGNGSASDPDPPLGHRWVELRRNTNTGALVEAQCTDGWWYRFVDGLRQRHRLANDEAARSTKR